MYYYICIIFILALLSIQNILIVFIIWFSSRVDSSVMHKYSKPGVFTVGVECTTSDWHVTAQRVITIQESVGEFGVITCYSQNLSTEGTACQALYGTTLQLHVVLEAGKLTSRLSTFTDNLIQ